MLDKSRFIKYHLVSCDRINGGGGTYFVPNGVLCNGSVVSVQTCFFYNDEGNRNNNNFRLRVRVFRRMGNQWVIITHKKLHQHYYK